MLHLEEKLKYVEEEKHRLECRLKNTELALTETQTSLEQSHSKRKVSLCTLFVYNQCFSCIKSYQCRGLHVAYQEENTGSFTLIEKDHPWVIGVLRRTVVSD